jgi:hypothetical protein
LLQLTYDVWDGTIVRHRLAYVPCPVAVDEELLLEGEPIVDVVDLSLDGVLGGASILLRSPLRFDFDLTAASATHPASHLTLNSAECRIPCVAPVHPYRFLNFVFRHFYPKTWAQHEAFFSEGAKQGLGARASVGDDSQPHIAWRID